MSFKVGNPWGKVALPTSLDPEAMEVFNASVLPRPDVALAVRILGLHGRLPRLGHDLQFVAHGLDAAHRTHVGVCRPLGVCARHHPDERHHFMRSLGGSNPGPVVGIIFSGTGSDGTIGPREIKAIGGLAIAQDPASAEHDRMPRSAIDSGTTDHVVSPERMPGILAEYVRHLRAHGAGSVVRARRERKTSFWGPPNRSARERICTRSCRDNGGSRWRSGAPDVGARL